MNFQSRPQCGYGHLHKRSIGHLLRVVQGVLVGKRGVVGPHKYREVGPHQYREVGPHRGEVGPHKYREVGLHKYRQPGLGCVRVPQESCQKVSN